MKIDPVRQLQSYTFIKHKTIKNSSANLNTQKNIFIEFTYSY